MFGRFPTSKSILTLLALTTCSTTILVDASYADTPAQFNAQRLQIARVSRGLALLRQTVADLGKNIASARPAAVPTNVTTAPATSAPIGANKPTQSWETFDFYPGRSGEVVSYHNATGIGAAFRIREGGKLVQEYKLDFPFAERSAEQRVADAFMIQNCISDFNRVSKSDGGSFYIYVSSDPKIGLACTSTL